MKLQKLRVARKPRPLTRPGSFFTVEGYRLVNDYGGGKRSKSYSCESVHRRGTDGVAILVYRRGRGGQTEILLKECIRPPILLRAPRVRGKRPNPPLLLEIVAGSREPGDQTQTDLKKRAAAEILEEAGIRVKPALVMPMGLPVFTSPGGLSEEVHIFQCDVTGLPQSGAQMHGAHPLELHAPLHWIPLETGLQWLRSGKVADAKTEIAIRRFAEWAG